MESNTWIQINFILKLFDYIIYLLIITKHFLLINKLLHLENRI